MNFKDRYLEYKKKYIELKNLIMKGGVITTKEILINRISGDENNFKDEIEIYIDNFLLATFNMEIINHENLDEYLNLATKSNLQEFLKSLDKDKKEFAKYKILYLSNFYTKLPHDKYQIELRERMKDDSFENILSKFEQETIIDGTKITLSEVAGIPSKALLLSLNHYITKYKNIILTLEPSLGDSPRTITYKNFLLTDSDRYNNLIGYYINKVKLQNIIPAKTIFSQFISLQDSLGLQTTRSLLDREPGYNRHFMYGIISKYEVKNSDDIGIYSWGLGIENEVALYRSITNDNILNLYSFYSRMYSLGLSTDNDIQTKFRHLFEDNPVDFEFFLNNFIFANLSEGNDIEAGAELIEIITRRFLNTPVYDLVQELINNRKIFLRLINKILESEGEEKVKLYNNEFYLKVNVINPISPPKKDYGYLGSYHFNITLPHLQKGLPPDESFISRHLNFAIALQYIEPLLLSVYGQADPNSFGDEHMKTEASYRLFNSSGMFINSAKLIKDGFVPHREKTYDDVPEYLHNVSPNMYRENIVHKSRYEKSKIGMDISRRTIDYEKGKLSEYFGFEFRLMDYFPVDNVKQFFDLILLLAFYLDKSEINLTSREEKSDVYYNDIIRNQIKNIVHEGHNATLSQEYADIITDKLQIRLNYGETVYNALNNLNKFLIKFYNANKIVTKKTSKDRLFYTYTQMIGKENLAEVDIPNINRATFFPIIYSSLIRIYGDKLPLFKNIIKILRENLDNSQFLDAMKIILPDKLNEEQEEITDILDFLNSN